LLNIKANLDKEYRGWLFLSLYLRVIVVIYDESTIFETNWGITRRR